MPRDYGGRGGTNRGMVIHMSSAASARRAPQRPPDVHSVTRASLHNSFKAHHMFPALSLSCVAVLVFGPMELPGEVVVAQVGPQEKSGP